MPTTKANMSEQTMSSTMQDSMTKTTEPSSAPNAKQSGSTKAVKLRLACNCCFAAKVRCDGNKEGCKRCAEKKLDCTYSESMVGKVVGKRRKRPTLDAKLDESKSGQWSVATGPAALPSPAPSVVSEQQNKRPCTTEDWTNLISYDETSSLDFSGCDEQFINYDMAQDTSVTPCQPVPYLMQAGLPTPATSPPEMQFLSPSDLGSRQQSEVASAEVLSQMAFQTQQQMAAAYAYQTQLEDSEMLCIKLLANLKRLSLHQNQTFQSTTSLIHRTNLTVRRIMRDRSIRSNYTCHLLLTSIVLQLADLCEQLVMLKEIHCHVNPEHEFIHEAYLNDADDGPSPDQRHPNEQTNTNSPSPQQAVSDAMNTCSSIGDLLKRKPLNGFQVLGRHESAHVEVDVRLKRVLSSLP